MENCKKIRQTPKSEKPTIEIELKPVLAAWLRWIFKTPENETEITINRWHDVGKLIFSLSNFTEQPVYRPNLKNPTTLILPMTDNAWLKFKSNYVHIDEVAERQINDFIEAQFNLWCREMFWKGYYWGWTQKQVTNAILRGLNIRDNEANEASIIKNDYRNRRREETRRFKNLQELELQ